PPPMRPMHRSAHLRGPGTRVRPDRPGPPRPVAPTAPPPSRRPPRPPSSVVPSRDLPPSSSEAGIIPRGLPPRITKYSNKPPPSQGRGSEGSLNGPIVGGGPPRSRGRAAADRG